MRASTIFLIAAAVLLVVMAMTPSSDARIPRRKLQKLKKLAAVALLLKGKKKILFPFPLPLPLPLPLLQETRPVLFREPVHEPIAEPFAFAEPSAEPSYGGYGAHGGSLGGYGGSFGGHNAPSAEYW